MKKNKPVKKQELETIKGSKEFRESLVSMLKEVSPKKILRITDDNEPYYINVESLIDSLTDQQILEWCWLALQEFKGGISIDGYLNKNNTTN